MKPWTTWLARLGIAGACFLVTGCGGSDIPDASDDGQAATGGVPDAGGGGASDPRPPPRSRGRRSLRPNRPPSAEEAPAAATAPTARLRNQKRRGYSDGFRRPGEFEHCRDAGDGDRIAPPARMRLRAIHAARAEALPATRRVRPGRGRGAGPGGPGGDDGRREEECGRMAWMGPGCGRGGPVMDPGDMAKMRERHEPSVAGRSRGLWRHRWSREDAGPAVRGPRRSRWGRA